MSTMEKIKCKCGKDWKIQDNLSAYEGEVVLVCDCGERYYNAQESFDDHWFSNLCHMVIKDEKDIQKIVDAVEKVVKELKDGTNPISK